MRVQIVRSPVVKNPTWGPPKTVLGREADVGRSLRGEAATLVNKSVFLEMNEHEPTLKGLSCTGRSLTGCASVHCEGVSGASLLHMAAFDIEMMHDGGATDNARLEKLNGAAGPLLKRVCIAEYVENKMMRLWRAGFPM